MSFKNHDIGSNGPIKKKKYRYIEIAPSRSVYDPVYLTFENVFTHEIIYRKALRWDLRK